MLRSGKRNCRVLLQKPGTQDSRTDEGEPVSGWDTYGTEWVSIESLSGEEVLRGVVPVAEATHRVKMRYRPDVNTAHRLLFGTRILEINHVDNVKEANRELWLTCKEKK